MIVRRQLDFFVGQQPVENALLAYLGMIMMKKRMLMMIRSAWCFALLKGARIHRKCQCVIIILTIECRRVSLSLHYSVAWYRVAVAVAFAFVVAVVVLGLTDDPALSWPFVSQISPLKRVWISFLSPLSLVCPLATVPPGATSFPAREPTRTWYLSRRVPHLSW